MRMWWYKHLQLKNQLLVANMSLMFKFSWEILFFESGDREVFRAARIKLFASNKKQIDNPSLMLDMLH